MPIYEFQNSEGQTRQVVAPIAKRPPEHIRFTASDEYVSCAADHPEAFARQYAIGSAHVRKFTTWRSPLTGGKIMDT